MSERTGVWLVAAGPLAAIAGFGLGFSGLVPSILAALLFYGGLLAAIVGLIRICIK